MRYFILTIGIIVLFSFNQSTSIQDNNIGDVKYSILPTELFNKKHKGTWVLLDGKDLSDNSKLAKFLDDEGEYNLLEKGNHTTSKLPDGRGVFIRGMNKGRDSNSGDPKQNRKVGSYQGDIFKLHDHSFFLMKGNGDKRISSRANMGGSVKVQTHETGGGDETRPKNIALYTYIKIN